MMDYVMNYEILQICLPHFSQGNRKMEESLLSFVQWMRFGC